MNPRKGKMQRIYDFFKQEIDEGRYSYGELFPTEASIAIQFKTSRPTIAKALNLLKEEGYVTRKAGYGTAVIKKINTEKHEEYRLGTIIPYLKDTEIFEPIFGEIAQQANKRNFSLAIDENNFSLMWGGNSYIEGQGQEYALQIAKKYIEQKVDGVFFSPLEFSEQALDINMAICSQFQNAGIPMVLLDRDFTSFPRSSSHDLVSLNHIIAGYEVARHLIELNCHKILFLSTPNVANTIEQRFIGVKIAAAEISDKKVSVEMVYTADTPKATVDKILRKYDLCSLICYNDAAAAKIIPEFLERGVKIPSELKVIAFDDVKYAKLLSIPLTTYRQPCIEIAQAAVNILLNRMKDPDLPPVTHQINGKLIIRQSTVE